MKTISAYLDDLKGITGSDYRSAKLLNVERNSVSTWRKKGSLSDENAIALAKALDIEPENILISSMAGRAEGEVKTVWEKISRITGIAASFLVLFQIVNYPFIKLADLVCILCQIMQKVQLLHMARFLIAGFPTVKEMSHVKN